AHARSVPYSGLDISSRPAGQFPQGLIKTGSFSSIASPTFAVEYHITECSPPTIGAQFRAPIYLADRLVLLALICLIPFIFWRWNDHHKLLAGHRLSIYEHVARTRLPMLKGIIPINFDQKADDSFLWWRSI